jgi:hypothetical protein
MAIHAHTHTIFSKDESEDQELARCVQLAVFGIVVRVDGAYAVRM